MMIERKTSEDPPAAIRPIAGRAALGFVLLTLAALVSVPILVQRQVEVLRQSIEASEPARTLVTRLQFSLAREMAALGEVELSGHEAAARTYAPARAAEKVILEELAPLAARLGPEVHTRYTHTRELAERWHSLVADDEIFRSRNDGARARLPRERALFEEVLRGASSTDSAILAVTARTREQIANTEETGLRLTLLLAVLALLAAMAVATLESRVRRFATESERRRQQAEDALAEAARANEARERLMRGITHDVKNPLGAAKGYAELLAMGVKAPIHPGQVPLVDGVQRSVDNALGIIADLLDVARADGGGLSLRPARVDLGVVVREAVENHRGVAETSGHEVELLSCPRVPVETDRERVQQILGNLLGNAIKYTPAPGFIRVSLDRADGWAEVRVADSGPGVPEEMREGIFDEFTRLDDRDGPKGHGLGLAISRRLAKMLGGELRMEDSHEGAVFLLRLPRLEEPQSD